MARTLAALLIVVATLAGSLPSMATGDFYVVSLTFMTKPWNKPLELHFYPGAEGSKPNCKTALPLAIAAFKDDLYKSFKANYGIDRPAWKKATFVEGTCRNDDGAYFQLLKLKLTPMPKRRNF